MIGNDGCVDGWAIVVVAVQYATMSLEWRVSSQTQGQRRSETRTSKKKSRSNPIQAVCRSPIQAQISCACKR